MTLEFDSSESKKHGNVYEQKLTRRQAGALRDSHPEDVVRRGVFLEAVPNADPISVSSVLELDKNLE